MTLPNYHRRRTKVTPRRSRPATPVTSGDEMSLSHNPNREDRSRRLFDAIITRLLRPLSGDQTVQLNRTTLVMRGDGAMEINCQNDPRCPRCGGFVYHEGITHKGTLSASRCANCGWQGAYQGTDIEEDGHAKAQKRSFDPEAIAERARLAKYKALRLAKSAKTK